MWRRAIGLFLIAVFLVNPGLVAAQSTSVAISVTILPTPLNVQVGPECAFLVTNKAKTVDCIVTLTLEQWTSQANGWRAMLTVLSVKDPVSGEIVPSRNVTLIESETFSVVWGQNVSPVGGPFVPEKAANGSFNHEHVVAAAKPGFGIGHYTVRLKFQLRAPASQAPGVYVPTWKVNIANSYS